MAVEAKRRIQQQQRATRRARDPRPGCETRNFQQREETTEREDREQAARDSRLGNTRQVGNV